MKQIYVPFLKELHEANIETAGNILEDSGQRGTIEVLNWPRAYSYRPITFFNIGHSNQALYIKFNVIGSMLRAIYSKDQDPVHEDSCVQFFCKPVGSERYTNFEFNCIGTASAASRKSEHDEVSLFGLDKMSIIERHPGIGRRAFNEIEGIFDWDLTVKIPFELMGLDSANLPEKILGNFHKCADGTDSPHYVSWSPIKSENPDFHRPEFFGELILNKR
ncbi:MAG TPA: carbohydrate-binding family 9-like protein [Paludibacter sp.]|nr:carbohydrate-binding family 9-like protein [Paludibacter sp.]